MACFLNRSILCRRLGLLALLCVAACCQASASAGQGSCERFEFPLDPQGRFDWPHPVKVVEDATPVFATPETTTPLADQVLAFNENLFVIKGEGTRLLVKKASPPEPLGWVERMRLLCAIYPQKGQTGLLQQFYLTTAPATAGAPPGRVTACRTAESATDESGCQEIKPAAAYVIFDEAAGRYLLGDSFPLDEVTRLTGWVRKSAGVIWDSASGLRPRENLGNFSDGECAGEERSMCAYLRLTDAMSQTNCQPILGGARWYREQARLPLIGQIAENGQSFYQTLLTMYQMTTPFERIYRFTALAYLPKSDDLTEDIQLTSRQLETWLDLLKSFDGLPGVPDNELRVKLVDRLQQASERVLRRSLYANTAVPLQQFFQQAAALPVRADSPVFRYSLDELRQPTRVPECEIARIAAWLNASRQMLLIVAKGTQRPQFTRAPFADECQAGQDIPVIQGEIKPMPFADPAMRYDHSVEKMHIYWVPKEFLP